MKKYRMRYTKGEKVKYISHLDMLKVFSRAAIRGDIPITYSIGFNPHPDFVFGLPLAVGVTSDAEYVDTSLDEEWPAEKLMETFNSTLPDGIKINECEMLEEGARNIMRSVKASSYYLDAVLSDGSDNGETDQNVMFDRMKNIFDAKQPLVVNKRTKRGSSDVDIMPLIFEFKLLEISENVCHMFIVTSAGNEVTLRPDLALSGLSGQAEVTAEICRIHRIALI